MSNKTNVFSFEQELLVARKIEEIKDSLEMAELASGTERHEAAHRQMKDAFFRVKELIAAALEVNLVDYRTKEKGKDHHLDGWLPPDKKRAILNILIQIDKI